jgi:hypothetical protein
MNACRLKKSNNQRIHFHGYPYKGINGSDDEKIIEFMIGKTKIARNQKEPAETIVSAYIRFTKKLVLK